LDSDVAELYGVETKAINQAIKRNPVKFPDGFLIGVAGISVPKPSVLKPIFALKLFWQRG